MPVYHLSKNASPEIVDSVNAFLQSEHPAFVLFYMDGCGPCAATRPEWMRLEDDFADDDMMGIIDIEMSKMQDLHNKKLQENVAGFPTLRYIRDGHCEDYEACDGITKDRSYRSFVEWIKKKEGKKTRGASRGGDVQMGGRRASRRYMTRRRRRVRRSRRARKSRRVRSRVSRKKRPSKKRGRTHKQSGRGRGRGRGRGGNTTKALEDVASVAIDGVADAAVAI